MKWIKAKPKAVIRVADGVGGMRQVDDLRFKAADWPIQLDLPPDQAETWLQYLSAECRKRGWSCGGVSQMLPKENEGSLTITSGGVQFAAVVWKRVRNGPMAVQAKALEASTLSPEQLNAFVSKVTDKCRERIKERFYFREKLEYQGMPWQGELWLSDSLRLGPPSDQDKHAIEAPRVILVDAEVEGIDRDDALDTFTVLRRQLSVFLSVLLRTLIEPPHLGTRRGWTSGLYPGQPILPSDVRWLEYFEPEVLTALPARGSKPAMPMRAVARPELARAATGSNTHEEVPADIIELWQRLSNLDPTSRQHFYEVGTMYQAGLDLGRPYQTASFTWLVAACEALKPRDSAYDNHTIYDVVKALLGKAHVNTLSHDALDPHEIRSVYLHTGRIRGSEFARHLTMSNFKDPSFDHAYGVLWYFVPAAIVEWLRRGAVFPPRRAMNRISLQTWARKHRVAGLALAFGVVLGWLARTALR